MNNNILKTQEVCEYLSLSKSSLYKLTSKKEIPFFKPNGGKLYFRKEDLDNWILSNKSESTEELEKKILNYLKKDKNGKKKNR